MTSESTTLTHCPSTAPAPVALRANRSNPSPAEPALSVRDLSVMIGPSPIFANLSFDLPAQQILGILGPSGVGKSTLLRCLNRLIDLTPKARVSGEIRFDGRNLLDQKTDTDALRARIAMIFQQPVIFPTSIERNVLFGLRHLRRIARGEAPGLAEKALREAALWDQVKDRLKAPAAELSIGQQQRLCLARALATEPEILLLDEPTSALDPGTAAEIEATLLALRSTRSLILVTHNPAQAERVCDSIYNFQPASR
ncbi:MAG: phosphate ABC transporter ATP-binding protein [Opitutales bacterium]